MQAGAENTTHQYVKPGTYVVKVQGEAAGAGPGILHTRVIVEPSPDSPSLAGRNPQP